MLDLIGTTLDQLPQDVLDQIWSIYSVWRNHKLWESRYAGFMPNSSFSIRLKNPIIVTKSRVNLISDIVKYVIKDESGKFQNYQDELYLKCKVDIEAYRIPCVSCFSTDQIIILQCNSCYGHYCDRCGRFGLPGNTNHDVVRKIHKCDHCKNTQGLM